MTDARAVQRAKELARGQGDDESVVTLSTGVRVRLHAVSGSLIEDVKEAIPFPEVPVVLIEVKNRKEENPNDPEYIKGVEETRRKRANAVLDALLIFGLELLDGIPEDERWLKQLRYLEKRGTLDLSGFDLDDEFDREFLYKKYVAVAGADLDLLAPLQSLRPEEVARARRSFLGDAARLPAGRVRDQALGSDGDRDEPADDRVGSGPRGEVGPVEVGGEPVPAKL
jgi:hypothetical protein